MDKKEPTPNQDSLIDVNKVETDAKSGDATQEVPHRHWWNPRENLSQKSVKKPST